MNRIIKFRIWDSQLNKFGYFDLFSANGNTPIDCRDSIQQFTGLSDKSGKKIYEGDIVTLRTTSHDYQTKVIFIDGCFAFRIINPQGTLSLVFAHNIASGHFEAEVVGNIFENPELLV